MSDPDIQGGEHLKPETEEVLNELEAEGHTIEGREPKEAPKDTEPKAEEPQKPEGQPEAEPAKVEDPAPEAGKPKERETKAVPVNKFNEERHKRQDAEKRAEELQAKLDALGNKPASPEATADIKAIAEKYGIEEAVLADIVAAARAGAKPELPADIADKLKTLDVLQQENLAAKEEKAFNLDFDSVAKALSEEGIDITGHKDQIKQLAYTEGYTTTSLRAIALEYAHDNGMFAERKKSAEKSSGRSPATAETLDFDNMTEEEAKKLPPDLWDKYVEHQVKQSQKARGNV